MIPKSISCEYVDAFYVWDILFNVSTYPYFRVSTRFTWTI